LTSENELNNGPVTRAVVSQLKEQGLSEFESGYIVSKQEKELVCTLSGKLAAFRTSS
jgi:hypothetical protein